MTEPPKQSLTPLAYQHPDKDQPTGAAWILCCVACGGLGAFFVLFGITCVVVAITAPASLPPPSPMMPQWGGLLMTAGIFVLKGGYKLYRRGRL